LETGYRVRILVLLVSFNRSFLFPKWGVTFFLKKVTKETRPERQAFGYPRCGLFPTDTAQATSCRGAPEKAIHGLFVLEKARHSAGSGGIQLRFTAGGQTIPRPRPETASRI